MGPGGGEGKERMQKVLSHHSPHEREKNWKYIRNGHKKYSLSPKKENIQLL